MMTDFLKPARKHMHHETPYELDVKRKEHTGLIFESERTKMYAEFFSVIFNFIFGICLSFTSLVIVFMYISEFEIEMEFITGFWLYNIIWLICCIGYNVARYRRQGAGRFFWMSIILPAAAALLLLWTPILYGVIF